MSISDRIFELIKSKGLTQKEFSRRTGIAESTICDWKRKGLNPSSDKLAAICNALDISSDELLGISKPDYSISSEEQLILEAYRYSDTDTQRRLLEYVNRLTVSQPQAAVEATVNLTANREDCSPKQDVELTICKNLVRRLRRLARLDRIRLDECVHSSRLNKHLFSYFDYIGINKLEFIKDYISHLQPFMISEIRSQEKFDNAICVLDEYYRISLYIKVDASQNEEIIVSFHENHKGGIARQNSTDRRIQDVYVFADSIASHIINTNTYTINLYITRGVKTFPINVAAHSYDDEGFMVHYRDIQSALVDIVNGYLQDLYTSDIDFSNIEPFSSLQQLSFTSYGNDVFSNISILIDSLLLQKDSYSRQIADGALCIYCDSLQLTQADRMELIDTLNQRFSVNSIRVLPEIINRINAHLSIEA